MFVEELNFWLGHYLSENMSSHISTKYNNFKLQKVFFCCICTWNWFQLKTVLHEGVWAQGLLPRKPGTWVNLDFVFPRFLIPVHMWQMYLTWTLSLIVSWKSLSLFHKKLHFLLYTQYRIFSFSPFTSHWSSY
jgi:hypothetical protein